MLDCLILGDSIAVGVGMARPECMTVAEVGITSEDFAYGYRGPEGAQRVILCLGSNDKGDSSEALAYLRQRINGQVLWILPARRYQQGAVRKMAQRFGDKVVTIPSVRRDGVHPADYRRLADLTR
jgi:hypothetical protein